MTAPKPDFAAALRDADRALGEAGMPAEVDARLRERLDARRARASTRGVRMPILAFGVAAVAAAVLALVGLENDPAQAPTADRLAFAIEGATNDLRYTATADGRVRIEQGACDLVDADAGLRITTLGELTVESQPEGVRVVRGAARFAVRTRLGGEEPARILVSGGAIEVLGTDFTVRQGEGRGEVALHEGRIRFVASDGRTRELAPGESLAWPLPTTPVANDAAPTAIDTAPAAVDAPPAAIERAARPRPERAPARDAGPRVAPEPAPDVLSELARHRSRGEFARAIALLDAALDDHDLTPSLRERLSYELGDIRAHHGGDRDAACAHFEAHLSDYPDGRYQAEVESARRRLDCEGTPR